ncbi:MAG: NAD(P)H-binding protein [Burkholderiaceae bacterium]|nr:NAD(P)H-binding protein [Burkholderiaceae bacterium]
MKKQPRLLVIGCGDVGMRLLALLRGRYRIFAVTRQAGHVAAIRAAGATPIIADLDQPDSLARLTRLASRIVHLAPPPSDGENDKRTRNLIPFLPPRARLVYVSTTGVYGDCAGELVAETRAVKPQNVRAKRRVDAEQCLRAWARRSGSCLSILRVPGIYARERLPIERLQKGTPTLRAEDDVYTNHIHADDLAHIIALALVRGMPNRVVHAADDSDMKMGDYFDVVARAFDLPPPPRLPREQLRAQVSPVLYSFMAESRRLDNRRLKEELGVRLRYRDVVGALATFTGRQS